MNAMTNLGGRSKATLGTVLSRQRIIYFHCVMRCKLCRSVEQSAAMEVGQA